MITLVDMKIKKIRENAIMPRYAHGFEDSGMDVFASQIDYRFEGKLLECKKDKYTIKPNETILVKTGFAVEIPKGTELQARPTSGNSLKTMLRVANAPGTIDSGYRNEIGIILTNTGNEPINVCVGDKIAQLVLCPVYHANIIEIEELEESKRGLDGYGSTGTIKDVKDK